MADINNTLIPGNTLTPEYKSFSNVLILRHIFCHLSLEHLQACSQVSKLWKSEAEYMMHQINLEMDTDSLEKIFVQEIIGEQRYSVRQSLPWQEALSHLQILKLRKHRLHISLHLLGVNLHHPQIVQFMQKFGSSVFRLTYETNRSSISPSIFFSFLCQQVPLIEELFLDDVNLKIHDPSENSSTSSSSLNNQKLKLLKNISFFRQEPDFRGRLTMTAGILENLINLAPNLKNIANLPVESATRWTHRGHLVESLSFPYEIQWDSSENVEVWLREFSKSRPKLKFLDPPRSSCLGTRQIFRQCKSYLFSILQSSKNSLEHLVICPSIYYCFTAFPDRFNALRILEFSNEYHCQRYLDRIDYLRRFGVEATRLRKRSRTLFPPNTNLVMTFPEVKEFRVALDELDRGNFQEYFPPRVCQGFQPLVMSLNKNGADCLDLFCAAFPSVQEMVLNLNQLKLWGLMDALTRLMGFNGVKTLTLEIDSCKVIHDYAFKFLYDCDDNGALLDSVFTGIPEMVCGDIRSSWKDWGQTEVTEEDLIDIEYGPSIVGLEGLETLNIIFTSKHPSWKYRWCSRGNCFPNPLFSEISLFGFRKRPQLNVNVRVQDEHPCIDSEIITRILGPAANHVNISMDSDFRDLQRESARKWFA